MKDITLKKLFMLLLSASVFLANTCWAMDSKQEDSSLDQKLEEAIDANDVAQVQLLITRGVNVNKQPGASDYAPLQRTRSIEIAELLLESGADFFCGDPQGYRYSPLFKNMDDNNNFILEIWRMATEHSAKIRLALAMAFHPRTGTMSTLRNLNLYCISVIASFLRPRDIVQNTEYWYYFRIKFFKNKAFLEAARQGNCAKLAILLKEGVDINARGDFDNNALTLALHSGKNWKQSVLLLLESGIDTETRNIDGHTAIEVSNLNPKGSKKLLRSWPQLVETSRNSRNTLCLAMHPRLGANSPTQALPREMFAEICSYLTPSALAQDI